MNNLAGTSRLLSTLVLVGYSAAHAGGFALIEQGASGMGNAYAGASAVSVDASTVWFNPAGMLELGRQEIAAAGHLIAVANDFTDQGTTLNEAFGPAPVPGTGRLDSGGNSLIPNFYYVRQLKDNLAFGLGISAPFGNSTEYNRDWVGRYQAVESGVSVIDINPSVAYRINERFSIGGGLSVQIMDATLGNAVDSGATCIGLAARGNIDLAQCLGAGLTTPGVREQDGYAEVTGDSVAVTFNLGMLFKPTEQTRLGVAYRHSIDHDLDGDVDFDTNAALAAVLSGAGVPLFQDGGALAKANLPASLMFSVAHQITDKIQLLGDATWTGWSAFKELRITFDNPVQPDSFNTQAWKDVWRISGGVNYTMNKKLTLRTGLAYDQDPVPSPTRRTARIPGNDRTWFSLGAGYRISDRFSVDVGYAHLFVDETPIANASEAAGGTTIRGLYDTDVNLFSAQFNWLFM